MSLSDEEAQEHYILWRSNPNNDSCHDIAFCSNYGVPADRLHKLRTLDVIKQIAEIRSSIKIKCPHCHREMKIYLFGKG